MSQGKDFSNSTSNNSGNATKWVLGGLLAVVAIVAIYFGISSNSFKGKTEQLQGELSALNEEKTQLQGEYQSLEGDYQTQITENDSLTVEIEERVKEVNDLKVRLDQVKGQLASSKANADKIKERLAQMEELKNALETDLENLKVENSDLLANNSKLTNELVNANDQIGKLTSEVAELSQANDAMNEKFFRLAPAGYRADNFNVVLKKRNDKLASKAKQVDEIKVKFNLNDVPSEKFGESEIYIAVTDIRGETISMIPAKDVTIKGRSQNLKVMAADVQKVNLKGSQTIDMSIKPTDNLKGGEYNLMVYSEDGYLGSTGFILQ